VRAEGGRRRGGRAGSGEKVDQILISTSYFLGVEIMLLFSSKKSKPRENEYVLCCFLVARNQNQEKMNMS
jgi:hypothetical protein